MKNKFTQNKPKQRLSFLSFAAIIIVYLVISRYQGDAVPVGQEATRTPQQTSQSGQQTTQEEQSRIPIIYEFRDEDRLIEHFEKHGDEFTYASEQEYLEGANRVIASPEVLHKLEAEDGDDVYFLEATGEFVIVSKDGYIRTYFKPEDGIDYFNRQ